MIRIDSGGLGRAEEDIFQDEERYPILCMVNIDLCSSSYILYVLECMVT